VDSHTGGATGAHVGDAVDSQTGGATGAHVGGATYPHDAS
jgi:hypothetical protein